MIIKDVRDKMIVNMRRNSYTMEEIATIFNLTKQRVKQLLDLYSIDEYTGNITKKVAEKIIKNKDYENGK